jgi:hypothetical protein
MNKTRVLIASTAALLLGLVLAGQSPAQSPTPILRRVNPSTGVVVDERALFNWAGGEARFGHGGFLTCILRSGASGSSYHASGTAAVVLKFSFGQAISSSASPSASNLGSWAIRLVSSGRTFAQSPIIFAGDFTGGSILLSGRTFAGPAPHVYLLSGKATVSDGRCFEQVPPKDITIQGNCDRPQDGVNFKVFAGERVYARGTFMEVNASCGTSLGGGIDRNLNMRPR